MEPSANSRTASRYDRHVRRARLSVARGAPARRLAFLMEEALRLASLPGENEGRAYYFRHLRIDGLPADGNRGIWMERFQRMLSERAADAVHGGDARAGSAAAVYFRGEEEALEILLHRAIEQRPAAEWFWPAVLGESAEAPRVNAVAGIVERLRAREASWVAVAAAVFAARKVDAARFLSSISPAVARAWLREMEIDAPVALREQTHRLTGPVRQAIEQALAAFGEDDARTVWLAAMAALVESPAELAAGLAVERGRRILRYVATRGPEAPAANVKQAALPLDAAKAAEPAAVHADGRGEVAGARQPLAESEAPMQVGAPEAEARIESISNAPSPVSSNPPLRLPVANGSASAPDAPAAPHFDDPHEQTAGRIAWRCLGTPTSAAGLFFLLNAMRELGIARTLAGGLGALAPDFACRVLHRLASHAGIEADDPARQWLDSVIGAHASPVSTLCDATWWPANVEVSRERASVDFAVRVWALAVRRWCWRAGWQLRKSPPLSARGIVMRGGIFSVNRADLDVSLALDEVDIRIRLLGLDLDPGWLPWFGRVVRFHYLYRGELHG